MPVKASWIRVEVSCEPDYVDDLSAEIAQALTVGIEITTVGLCFYLHEDFFFAHGQKMIEQVLGDFRETRGIEELLTYSSSSFVEDDWLEKWKVNFKPLRVGRHWIIAPTWEEIYPGPKDRMIRIDPGRAFGTGHHETTRLCLEWLEEWKEAQRDVSSKSLLDLGTGSGVLAIGGALLGFQAIVALDNDQEAIEVARQNIGLNGVIDRVELQIGTVDLLQSGFDVILANIQALPLIRMAGSLVPHLKESAVLVLSGVLLEQKEEVQAAYEAEGLRLRASNTAGEWCLLELVRSKE